MRHSPPHLATRFLRWFCYPELLPEIEGDLYEMYQRWVEEHGEGKARWLYAWQVLTFFRPFTIKKQDATYKTNHTIMFKNYFKIAFRNLTKHKTFSFINIGGLAVGMTVAMLIGLWIFDELSYNQHHDHYNRIAAVAQNLDYNGEIETSFSQSMQLGPELRNTYGSYFKHVVMSSMSQNPILSIGEKAITKNGYFMEAEAPELLSLRMLKGTRSGLQDMNAILLAESTATALFGDTDPIGEIIQIDNQLDVKVSGVYGDVPNNSSFNDLMFIAPLELLVKRRESENWSLGWVNNWLEVYVQLADHVEIEDASLAIKNAKLDNVGEGLAKLKPALFLFPMEKWRLYLDFENGENTGGYIEVVWLFGIIGIFVILLACINFMNLSTARSEKRAKEVGIRKVVGSVRSQLIGQFYSESLVMVLLAFLIAMVLIQLSLPWFNEVADKQISMTWTNYGLWLLSLGIVLFAALLSGSYPAFYLSAFSPGKVLKGTFRVGRNAALPRKALVIVQFTVSITLIIGTIMVYQQIQFVKDRPVGYDQDGLLIIPIKTDEVKNQYEAFRNDLLATGAIAEVSKSECAVTDMWWSDGGFEWKGKDPDMQDIMYRGAVDHDFGETVGWTIKAGRDFSRDFTSDSSAMILNEAAVAYMGLEDPIGETIKAYGKDFTVIGVVRDMMSQSLFSPVKQTFYMIDPFNRSAFINVKLNPQMRTSETLAAVAQTFKTHHPATPFDYQFADEQFANKFAFEALLGKLAGIFAVLAIFISCLGLFGLAAFVAEQRTKEIGIRKVLGASVSQLWQLLSKDFVVLVMLSCLIAIPIAWYLLQGWLQNYEYRTDISWWIFALAGMGALLITLLTVSFQAIKAAVANPVDSLRSE